MKFYPLSFLCSFLLIMAVQFTAFGQRAPIRIKGQIMVANSSQPLPSATVLVVSSMSGVSADTLGRFSITISPDDTLLIRSVGFKPQLYVPTSRTAAELKPLIYLEEDVTMLKEVEVSGRPSDAKIRTALNNMKRKDPNVTENPDPKPIIPEAMPSRPVEPSALGNPISFFSRQEREKRALQQILERVEAQEEYKRRINEKKEYNKLFKDNRGYQ